MSSIVFFETGALLADQVINRAAGLNDLTPGKRVQTSKAIATIVLALYLPQSWLLVMRYPWDSYRMHWITDLLLGLPTFFPLMLLAQPNKTPLIISTWCATALVAIVLFLLSRYSKILFWTAATFVCAWSIFSAMVAYSAFIF